jgi:hypothetical protein
MEVTSRRQTADKVLFSLVEMLRDLKAPEGVAADIGSYQNGREQGHSVRVMNYGTKLRSVWAAFAENRNSDSIVVYFADMDPMQSITDEMRDNAYFFGPDEHKEAAKFIVVLIERVLNDRSADVPRKKKAAANHPRAKAK